MQRWRFTKGLHDLGNGCHAYLQPQGSWGWSNAGLIADNGETLLVDTLMDVALTRAMLDAMRRAVPAAARIGTLVNTHANPDHTFGNQLLGGATIIASAACAEEMNETPPQMLAAMQKNWRVLGEGAAFFHETMGNFNFDEVVLTLPTRTFETELTLKVGTKEIRLLKVGPAHTRGDTMVHVPADRTVFTGDILFVGGHPVMWAGPVDNWIGACDTILGWDVETIVPGHGPICEKDDVRRFKTYLETVKRETRQRFDAGLGWIEAANDIKLDGYADWIDGERIVANVAALYREFSGGKERHDVPELFAAMGRWRKAQNR